MMFRWCYYAGNGGARLYGSDGLGGFFGDRFSKVLEYYNMVDSTSEYVCA